MRCAEAPHRACGVPPQLPCPHLQRDVVPPGPAACHVSAVLLVPARHKPRVALRLGGQLLAHPLPHKPVQPRRPARRRRSGAWGARRRRGPSLQHQVHGCALCRAAGSPLPAPHLNSWSDRDRNWQLPSPLILRSTRQYRRSRSSSRARPARTGSASCSPAAAAAAMLLLTCGSSCSRLEGGAGQQG